MKLLLSAHRDLPFIPDSPPYTTGDVVSVGADAGECLCGSQLYHIMSYLTLFILLFEQ